MEARSRDPSPPLAPLPRPPSLITFSLSLSMNAWKQGGAREVCGAGAETLQDLQVRLYGSVTTLVNSSRSPTLPLQ